MQCHKWLAENQSDSLESNLKETSREKQFFQCDQTGVTKSTQNKGLEEYSNCQNLVGMAISSFKNSEACWSEL